MPQSIEDWEQSVPQKTVWILGSGFSKSLGGPLLADLLSERGKRQLFARHPGWDKLNVVYEVYKANLSDSDDKASARLWEHAEEFLEFVDAATAAPMRELLQGRINDKTSGVPVEEFRERALHAIAGECSFDQWANPAAERWEPYLNWIRFLKPERDTVVTFNYDTVVEMAGQHVLNQEKKGAVGWNSAVLPWEESAPDPTLVQVVKLHGSTHWCHKRPSGAVPQTTGPAYRSDHTWDLASEIGYLPLIGMPGPSKARMRADHFDRLWKLAVERIKGATEIIFLGYRFPPSDSQARREILNAIQANQLLRLRIVTILGPDTHGKDSERITSLLTRTGRRREVMDGYRDAQGMLRVLQLANHTPVRAEPLYVEDFLSLLG